MPIFQLRPKDALFQLPEKPRQKDLRWNRVAPFFMRNIERCEVVEYPPDYRGDVTHKGLQRIQPFTQFLLSVDASGENADYIDIDGRVAGVTLDPQADASFLHAIPLGTSGDRNNFATMGSAIGGDYFISGVMLCALADDAYELRNFFPRAEPS